MTDEQRCPDEGRCHHSCKESRCFRVQSCGPLSGVYPDNCWPDDVLRAHGILVVEDTQRETLTPYELGRADERAAILAWLKSLASVGFSRVALVDAISDIKEGCHVETGTTKTEEEHGYLCSHCGTRGPENVPCATCSLEKACGPDGRSHWTGQ